jgi:3-hydroxyacyl-[acyl-carrier-protein] dehydratase
MGQNGCNTSIHVKKNNEGEKMTESTLVDIEGILKLLPHRYPFLMVDKVIELELGKRLVAIKNVSFNEPQFQGHFPVCPVMPGVLMLEALAQAGGILLYESTDSSADEGELLFLAGVAKARFKRIVVPGDQLILTVEFTRSRGKIAKIYGEATVDGELACSAEITCAKQKR